MLAQTNDVDSMARYLRKAVRYYLVSRARKTPMGAIRGKIEDLLASTPDFVQVPAGRPGAGRWHLSTVGGPPYAGEMRPLVEAAYEVAGVEEVLVRETVHRWRETGR